MRASFVFLIAVLLPATAVGDEREFFAIKVIDEATGRGVPLVELRTVTDVRCVTDSTGLVAFDEPGLMGQDVFFHVKSHGYEFPADGFGYRGKQLRVTYGGTATLKLKRINIAQRLYRVTGGGIYRDTVLLGRKPPIKQPTLNARVLGSDSVVNAVYKGKLHWFWGDTNRPAYPLGNFHVPGATSKLPGNGGLDPEVGVNLDYFTGEDGFAKPTAKLPGDGPTWISGLIALNADGGQRLFAAYAKIKPPLTVYERGLVEFDDKTQTFNKVAEFDLNARLVPHGHPFKRETDGSEYIYFGDPFPLVRVRATPQDLVDPSKYEAYTCLTAGSRANKFEIDAVDDKPRFRWRPSVVPYTPELQAELVRLGKLKAEHGLFHLNDDTDKPVLIQRGTVRWNAYRKRWIMIGVQKFGTSMLGEIWYAEAKELVGPWRNARKIVTHDKYSFYNPKQHKYFDKDGGRTIFFEGTYTKMFSGNSEATPRYDYNQIMYKLDLSDERLR